MPSPTTRRQFLTQALGSAGMIAGLPLLVPSRVFGVEAPSNKIGIGFIGVGARGSAVLANFLRRSDLGQVVAVSDCYQTRREAAVAKINKAAGGEVCTAYQDFRDLLARPEVDAVVIATPDHWHVPAGLLAVRAGKDLYVEKPLGLSIEEDFALHAAVRDHRRVFQYGTQQRSSIHINRGCSLIRNRRLGKILAIEVMAPAGATGGSPVPAPVPAGFDFEMYTGPATMRPYTPDLCTFAGSYFHSDHALGFIAGWGAHPLDVMCWAMGDDPSCVAVEISGTGTIPTTGLFDTPTTWDLNGRLGNGIPFTFTSGSDRTTFRCEHGTLSLSRSTWTCDPPHLWHEAPTPGDVRLRESTDHAGDFLQAIRERRDGVSNIDGALYSDLTSQLGYLAIRTGRTIRWDPVARTIPGDVAAARMMRRSLRAPRSL